MIFILQHNVCPDKFSYFFSESEDESTTDTRDVSEKELQQLERLLLSLEPSLYPSKGWYFDDSSEVQSSLGLWINIEPRKPAVPLMCGLPETCVCSYKSLGLARLLASCVLRNALARVQFACSLICSRTEKPLAIYSLASYANPICRLVDLWVYSISCVYFQITTDK